MQRHSNSAVVSSRTLSIGKSCVRFKKVEDVPLEVITEAVARVPMDKFLEHYEAAIPKSKRKRK